MFERFTDRAHAVIPRARSEAERLGHPRTGTEHLLLALMADPDCLAARVLREAGAEPDQLREQIRQQVGHGAGTLDEADAAALREIGIDLNAIRDRVERSFGAGALDPPTPAPRRGWLRRGTTPRVGGSFSPRARKVLELSLREALRLRHKRIGTEHILLGLLCEGRGLATLVLTRSGLDLDDLRQRVLTALRAAA